MNTNLYWDLEMSLANCPQLSLELFGEKIDLAILDFQRWGSDESVGIFSGDLEVTKMAWRPANEDPWRFVHSSAMELIRRAYYSQLMNAIDVWQNGRML